MNKKLNDLLVTKILDHVSQNIKPVEYLIDILQISKESAYRRMRSEIPFSFEEIALLSLNLGFSVDEIIGNIKKNRVYFDSLCNSSVNPKENFMAMFSDYYKFIELISKSKEKEVLASLNQLSPFLLIKYKSLFKLFYYKWTHQATNISVNHSFSETVVPSEILTMVNNFKPLIKTFSNINFIIDREVFLSFVREIKYYYNRKLITEKEVLDLKQDLIDLLLEIERLMQKGCDEHSCEYNFYLSLLDVETNTSWASFDTNIASHFWLHPVNSVFIYNQGISFMHKKWLESLKKYSVLITQSNEILQTKFIAKQREYIENITNNLLFYE
ncbi:MAG: hypothetical protein LBP83_05180 [Dysgonamonadaceae bacterium]|jgi:hypothetical protein|nr:hypothetical protein [Dysgonamonadaceae bacterium]